MMTQLITSAPDLAAPTDTPDAADSPDSSDAGFATLLIAICAAPAPLPLAIPTELTEAAPSPLVLLPGDGLNLNPAGLNAAGLTADDNASLSMLADAAATAATDAAAAKTAPALAATATDAGLLLDHLVSSEAALTAIQSEVNPAAISPAASLPAASLPAASLPAASLNDAAVMTSSSGPQVDAATPSAASAGTANSLPGAWSELDGDGAKAAQPLQAEAARRDLFSLASALAETNRQTRPPLTAAALSSFLAGGGDESSAKQTANAATSAASSSTAQAFNLEMASVSNAFAAGPQSAAITGQIINPMLVASDTLRQRETRTLRLNLQPEDLGEVEVQITRHAEGQFSARLSAEHEFARQALTSGLSQLRAALERAGLPVERLEVSLGPGLHFGSSGQTENQSQSQSESPSEPRLAATGWLEEPGVTSGRAAQDRLLSLRA